MSKPVYKKTKFWVLVFLILGLILRFFFPTAEEIDKEEKSIKKLTHVRTAIVKSEKFNNELKLFGNAIPFQHSILISKYSGDITEIYKKQGDLVKKDDELAQNYLCQAIATGNLDAALYLDEKYLKIRELFSGLLDEIKGDKVKVEPQKPCIKTTKLGRNEPCSCGSNLKYKNCCGK